jgi:hypothetical protein
MEYLKQQVADLLKTFTDAELDLMYGTWLTQDWDEVLRLAMPDKHHDELNEELTD